MKVMVCTIFFFTIPIQCLGSKSHDFMSYIRQRRSLSSAEEEEFVDSHNDRRRDVSPNAANMLKMEWSDKLAKQAQKWADKCIWEHDGTNGDYRDADAAGFNSVGQNLWAGTGGYDVADVVQQWYDEYKDYDFNTRQCTPNKPCGHYTQVVWHNSYAVGCGINQCSTIQGLSSSFTNAHIIVCNYGDAGNYVGQDPYTKGSACSQCPTEYTNCDDKLCSKTSGTSGLCQGYMAVALSIAIAVYHATEYWNRHFT